ncbi:MAG: cytochrome c biogenesis protein CcsA [Bacteroidetes bacterium]|nr:cytochrome c biogenesis protein CcsA [Bacteroidota bacterium]MBS1539437.1 cytochrome c biogenesis protein CcsA [Bacteroidota bacterium]
MHYFIGNLGHLFVIISFVASLVTAFSYWKNFYSTNELSRQSWSFNGRIAFYIHTLAVLGIVTVLFTIIYRHYFEYHYAYSHSSRHLPGQYMVSCFWEGQEGSFLLWMFWQAVLGIIVIHTQRTWQAPVMIVFALVQAFLASMILGVVIPGLDFKIGSSPFILLRDAMNDPIFKTNPDFIPTDGRGLNPLLQNYWMVIHPPTLFLGFALTLPPFAFCIAGLWLKKYSEWIKPALPWTLVGGAILGLGILMGGYWAYETLSFGGYWNWDPVENAVYVPWIVLIAAIHVMMLTKSKGKGLRTSIILIITVFILVLYSTFLTRSGILGDASVHSFTDLGLSGQLLLYLLFFTVAAAALIIVRWKQLPADEKEISAYSSEFWIFIGATVLCLMGFQVLLPTSIPVYNKIIELFGGHSNLAPPANQVAFYSKFQLWFAVGVALVSGTAQFFWWTRMSKAKLKDLLVPALVTLILFAVVISIAKVYKPTYLVLTLAGVYLIVSNAKILLSTWKVNPSLSGGAIAHIGVALMLIGLMFSSGYSNVVSLNNSGLIVNKDMGTDFNRDNLLLFINEPKSMAGYDIEYRSENVEFRNKKGYVRKNDIEPTNDPYRVVATKDIVYQGKKMYSAKDTFEIYPENTFYEIEMRKNGKVAATLYPRIQINPSMGGFLASPDIKRNFDRDIYTHVSLTQNREEEPTWGKPEEVKIKIGQRFFINDYVSVLEEVKRIEKIDGVELTPEDVAVKARVRVEGEHEPFYAEPVFLIRNKTEVGRIPAEINDLGVRVLLANIHPQTGEFSLLCDARQKDWVVIKALEKPYINILWLGTGVLMIGFGLSAARSIKEFRK